MQGGTVSAGGTLDASAPNGGNGGFIETSAAHVMVPASAQITTAAASGTVGNWLIDPQDFTIGSGATDNISGVTLSQLLVTNSVTISTSTGSDAVVAGTPPVSSRYTATPGNGDINVNDPVSWTASSNPTTLTLNALRDVNINAAVVVGSTGNLVVCCGRDINVNAVIKTTNGSVLLSAGRNVNQKADMTTIDGNIQMCAAQDINVGATITLKNGSSIAGQSLGLPLGLTLNAGTGGTGPGVDGGTVIFAALAPPAPITNAPVTIYYNPVSYTAPTDYATKFTLTAGAKLTQYMLVFPDGGSKSFNGTTGTSFSSLKGAPAGVSLIAGPGSSANFDSAVAGTGKSVTFSGYSLAGTDATKYAFATSCCGPVVSRTSADIAPANSVPSSQLGAAPSATASNVVPAFFLPSIPMQASGRPLIVASLGSQPPTEVVEVAALEAPVVVERSALVRRQVTRVPYVAPVRPRKQDRH